MNRAEREAVGKLAAVARVVAMETEQGPGCRALRHALAPVDRMLTRAATAANARDAKNTRTVLGGDRRPRPVTILAEVQVPIGGELVKCYVHKSVGRGNNRQGVRTLTHARSGLRLVDFDPTGHVTRAAPGSKEWYAQVSTACLRAWMSRHGQTEARVKELMSTAPTLDPEAG